MNKKAQKKEDKGQKIVSIMCGKSMKDILIDYYLCSYIHKFMFNKERNCWNKKYFYEPSYKRS